MTELVQLCPQGRLAKDGRSSATPVSTRSLNGRNPELGALRRGGGPSDMVGARCADLLDSNRALNQAACEKNGIDHREAVVRHSSLVAR